MSNPKLTVLMPVYNAASYLHEAIDSILQQTFRDFEFLIIDDGSTDQSIAIVQSYKDPRIRFVRNETNVGIAATLNRGIELASCELIARMDADDISYPDRLQKQYDYMMHDSACALLSTWCRVVTAAGKHVRLERYTSRFFYYNLTFECWIYHPTVMFRKAAVKEVGMYSMPYSEDYDLFWKLAQKFRIANLGEILLDYRLSPTSLNTVLRKKEYDVANRKNVLRNLRHYMGNDFSIPEEYLECLRHHTVPIATLNDIPKIVDCLAILEQITEQISKTPNVNRNENDIAEAAWFKRDFIVYQLFQELPWPNNLWLLVKTRKLNHITRKTSYALRWRIKKIKHYFSFSNNKVILI
ncbi:glycosyltransferase family 2 protein [Ohtaekwangia kribbensis]|jgi:glycosyltransferase involved in cell wall biosynthesis|uniref:Glycosyltransferase family 2 protein n=1 Tax=Ohtaekwangia kribbensis TaxID=688913 RepID=A0ABW3KEA0_9BACT